jgi:SAM-dependent methyltransferase
MSSYVGKHAEYYDTIYTEKPYTQEAAFVHTCLQKYGRGKIMRLLELACGTGRHALELEKLGYKIVATDYSPDLLAVAIGRANELKSKVDFRLQDMREISLVDAPFDAAYCLFDSIGYVQSNEGVQKVLANVYRHLRPDGLFVFEFWHAAAMVRSYELHREREWKTAEGKLKRVATTRLDIARQLAEVNYEFEHTDLNGYIEHFQETQVNRYFLIQEMSLFLEIANLEPLDWLTAYVAEKPISEDTWHILAIARRN